MWVVFVVVDWLFGIDFGDEIFEVGVVLFCWFSVVVDDVFEY